MEKVKFKNSRKYKGIVQKVFVKDGQPVKKDEVLAIISTQLEKIEITSPIDGIVKNVYIIESLIVSHNDPVFDIINQAELKSIIKKPSKINDTLKEALVEFGHLDSLIDDYNSLKDNGQEPDYTVEEIINKRKEELLEKHYVNDEKTIEENINDELEDNFLSRDLNSLYSDSLEEQSKENNVKQNEDLNFEQLEEKLEQNENLDQKQEEDKFEDPINTFSIEEEKTLELDTQNEELKEIPLFEEQPEIKKQLVPEEETSEKQFEQINEDQKQDKEIKENFEEPQSIKEDEQPEEPIECCLPKDPSFINTEEIKNIEPIKEETSEELIVNSVNNQNYKEIDFRSHNLNSTSHVDFQVDITGLMNLFTLMYEPLMLESINLKLNIFFIKAIFKTIAKFDVIEDKTISFSSKYNDQIITKEIEVDKDIDLKQLARVVENKESINKLNKISLIDLSDFDIYNAKLCLQKNQLLQLSISAPQRKIVDEITVINYVNITLTFNNNSLNLSDAIKFITEFNNIIKNSGFLI